VRCVFGGAILIFDAMKEIAADVATGDAKLAHHCNHDMSKVLTDAAPLLKARSIGEINVGALRRVLESIAQGRG